MKLIDPEPLTLSVERLLIAIEDLSGDTKTIAPDKLERHARAISIHLKAISDISAHNARIQSEQASQKYLSYEDLPPPPPEDRARIIARLQALYDHVNAGGDVGEDDEGLYLDDNRA